MLAGGGLAVFLRGGREPEAMAAFLAFAGLASLVALPVSSPRFVPVVLGLVFLGLTLLVQLPLHLLPVPAWRAAFPCNSIVSLGSTIAAMPNHALWWSALTAASLLVAAVLLTVPLRGRELAVFLHGLAFIVAAYAVVSIFDRQSGWNYPFAGDAVFGLLPNRNHTATLLVVGSVVAFGLMQWELGHGHRGSAVFAALCGAPSLAALLFFSISRAGVIMLAVGFALWALGAARSFSNRRPLLISAAVLIVFLAGLFVFGGSAVRDRITDFSSKALAMGAISRADGPEIDFRQPIFRDTFRMISEAPLTGVGLGHFACVFPQYRVASVRAAAVLHPESDWLLVVAECGWPATAVLLALAVWFMLTCWRARGGEDGLLRWTVAAAIGAAILHGLVDVPWHGTSLGWLLMVTAFAAVPARGGGPRAPWIWRLFQILAGLTLLGAGGYVAWHAGTTRPPLPFRWAAYNAELTELAKTRKHDDGAVVAKEAIADFPLSYEPYYWYAAFLRTFLGTEAEMAEAGILGRYVEPIHSRVASEQALVWADIDPKREAEARIEAVRRAQRTDLAEGRTPPGTVEGEVRNAIEAAKARPQVQFLIGRELSADPTLAAVWLRLADPEPVAEMIAGIPDLPAWLDAVPETQRRAVLERLVAFPDPSAVVTYMRARSTPAPGPYWRPLAVHEAASGDKPAAVARVAEAVGAPLEAGGRGLNEFGRQIAALEAQGNDVAVRRLLAEAASPGQADADKLEVAMAWFAAAGDWDTSWQAASRLAQLTKSGQ